jgi:hypothetical protein
MTVGEIAQLEAILYAENSVIAPDDVELLMVVIKREMCECEMCDDERGD